MEWDSTDQEILTFLDSISPEGITARQLAKLLNLDESTGYRRLKRLHRNGDIQRVSFFPTRYAAIVYEFDQQKLEALIRIFENRFPGISERAISMLTPEAQQTAREYFRTHFEQKSE